MKIAEFIKEKFADKGTSNENAAEELAPVLNNILAIEARRDAAKTELENARRHLEHEQDRSIDADPDADIGRAVQGVVGCQASLESLESLYRQAMTKAVGLIAAGGVAQRQRLAACERELVEVQAGIDARRIADFARFARAHGLRVNWPSRDNGGSIILPALSIEGEALFKIADAVVAAVHSDEDADRLDALRAERTRLLNLTRSQPNLALDSLLAERRRR